MLIFKSSLDKELMLSTMEQSVDHVVSPVIFQSHEAMCNTSTPKSPNLYLDYYHAIPQQNCVT